VEFEINDKSPVHPNAQLADQLREKITTGEIEDRLPSLNELIEASGLTSNTVQRAIRILKAEGLVYAVKGRGTFVRRDG
jgi:DNA-binding GntR family transcriptional regulator